MVRGVSLAVVLALAATACGSEESESWSATDRLAFVERCEVSLNLPPEAVAEAQQAYDLTDDETADLLSGEAIEEYKGAIEDDGRSMNFLCGCLFDGIAERASPSNIERMTGRDLFNFMTETVVELDCFSGDGG